MEQIMTCPRCGGSGIMWRLDRKKFDETLIVEWLEKPCPVCKGKGARMIDTDKLVKI